MAATNRLFNFLRHSSSLRQTMSPLTTVNRQVRWYCLKFDDKYFEKLVKDRPVVLFMKGVPSAPMCGFSRLVVQILHMHGVEGYDHYDVLEDVDFKEGMKKYSNWPTFPQIYMNGELVGGADILLQLHQNGELIEEFNKVGHKSALLNKDSKNNNNQ